MKRWLVALIASSAVLGGIVAKQSFQTTFATPGSGPTAWPPASWSAAAWFIDRSNSSTCASDTACNGQSATCAGSGACPFVTYNHLYNQVWQCFGNPDACPRLRQNTTITFLGPGESGGNNTDPVYATWSSENGAQVTVSGTATLVQSGTFAALTAKNTATGQLLNVTLASSTGAAVGDLLVNTTRANSHATLAQLVSGNNWAPTQPQSTPTIPPSQNPAENNAWASGDSYQLFTLTNVNVVYIVTPTIDINGAFTSITTLQTMNIYDPTGASDDNIVIDPSFVTFQDVNVQRNVSARAHVGSAVGIASRINTLILGAYFAAVATNPTIWFGGGIVGSAAYQESLPAVQLRNDVILRPGGTPIVSVSGLLGSAIVAAYIGPGKTLDYVGGFADFPSHASYIWGPGTLNLEYNARISIPTATDGGATAALLNAGGLQLDTQTKSCLSYPANAATTQVCNIAVTPANIDSNLNTGIAGCLTAGQGSSAFCNFF
jgi:hypothetical protein